MLTTAKRWARSQRWVTGVMDGLGVRPLGHSTLLWVREDDACRRPVELAAGLDDLVDNFRPHRGHVYCQEEDPATGGDGDHLVAVIFSVMKTGADALGGRDTR